MESITLQASDTAVVSGDKLGQLQFAASAESDAGASRLITARILAQAEGPFTSSSNPSSLVFATSSSDSNPAVSRIKIDNNGDILPLVSDQYSLGSSTLKFNELFASTGNFDSVVTNDSVVFASGNTGTVGLMRWNDDDGTVDLGLKGGNVTLQIGQENIVLAFNDHSSQINDGQVVSINGAQGQRISVIPAVASGDYVSSHAIGIATENITAGENGFITTYGVVRNLNTYIDGSSEGKEIYVSTTTPGGWTTTRPQPPNHAVRIGYIQREHVSAGSIFVSVQVGEHLEYLHDVSLTTPSSGDIIRYDSSDGTWKNVSAGSLGIGTVTSIATNNGVTGGTITTTGTIGLTGQALALHNLSTNGLITRTGTGTVAGRTITGTTNQVIVSNGDGVSGNPTLSLPQDIHTSASPTFASGIFTNDVHISGDLVVADNFHTNSTRVAGWHAVEQNSFLISEEGVPEGLFFKPDGTMMFAVGTANDRVYAYDLSTAWDLNSASYNNVSLLVNTNSVGNDPRDLYISPSGDNLYIVNTGSDRIGQWSLSTPWDLLTGTFVQFISINSIETNPKALYFKDDGTRLYFAGETNDDITQIDLSTPWDISTTGSPSSFSLNEFSLTAPQGIEFNSDGTRLYIIGLSLDKIVEFDLSSAWDITTATYAGISPRLTHIASSPTSIYFNDTANKAFIIGNSSDRVYELNTSYACEFITPTIFDKSVTVDNNLEVREYANFIGRANFYNTTQAWSTFETRSTTRLGYYSSALVDIASLTNTGNVTINALTANYLGTTGSNVSNINLIRNFRGGVANINIGVNSTAIEGGGIINVNSDTDEIDHLGKLIVGGPIRVDNNENLILTKDALAYTSGTLLFLDTFVEASDTDITLHTPDTGTGYTEVIRNNAGTVYALVDGGDGFMRTSADAEDAGLGYTIDDTPSSADYEIRAVIRQQQGSDDIFWLMVRYQDSDNFYALSMGTSTAYVNLFKKVSGVVTTIANLPYYVNNSVSDGINVPVTLRVIGNSISVFYNDIYRGTYVDSDITSAGKAGFGWGNLLLGSSSAGYEIDDAWRISELRVTEIPQSLADSNANSYINKGRFGIGTTSPESKLHINSSSTTQTSLLVRSTALQTSPIQDWQNSSSESLLMVLPNGSLSGVASGIFMDSIGIGTNAPAQRLHVNGNIRVSGAYYDSSNSPGTNGQVLVSTATGTDWQDISVSGGGNVTSIATNNGITGGTITTTGTIGLTGQALALHNLSTNGLITRTGAGTVDGRTITGTSNQVTVTNGDGVAGNPTLSLPQDIHTSATPTFAGATLNGSLGIRASSTASAATQIPVFTADPTSTTRTITTRTPAELRADIGAQATLTNPVTGTGSSGRVSFWTGTTTQGSDSSFFWDDTEKRLGIGTSSPVSNLHVETVTSAKIGVVVQGAASQVGDLQQWRNSSTSVLVKVDGLGNVSGVASATFNNVNITSSAAPVLRLDRTANFGGTDWAGESIGVIDFYSSDPSGPRTYARISCVGGEDSGTPNGGIPEGDIAISVYDQPNGFRETARFTANGNVGIGTSTPAYKLEVSGDFAATTKSFIIDHPTKPGKKLRYASLEGPENGVYFRGSNDNDTIELPDYWHALVDEDTITVNLTPVGCYQQLYVESQTSKAVKVGGTNGGTYYFVVYAERKDVPKLETEVKWD